MRKHSFTLLEMVVVLLVITIVSLLALRSFRSSDDLAMEHAEKLLALLAGAHSRAMNGGATETIAWDPAGHAWHCGGKKLPAPDAVRVNIGEAQPDGEDAVFIFYPDGSARAVSVELSAPGTSAEVRVFPLSGTAEIRAAGAAGGGEIRPLWLKDEAI